LCAGLYHGRENLLRNKAVIYILTALAAPLSFTSGIAAQEDFTHLYALENGATVTVYTPEGILSEMTVRDDAGNLVFYPEGGGLYYLIEDIDDPVIANKGSGEFLPVSEEYIVDALRDIEVPGSVLDMHVDIYILPLPRLFFISSSSSGCRIFMSPGVWEVPASTAAAIAAHEFGHCYQRRYLPEEDVGGWDSYLAIRGLTDEVLFNETGARMYRPSEIFAEDFRLLFGGELASVQGTAENPEIALPADVPGLASFMASLSGGLPAEQPDETFIASAGNYPNPFNPVTTIRATFNGPASGRDVTVSIYAADGSLVRDLGSSSVEGETFEKEWDGLTGTGARASSGIYFYRITAGAESRTGKMILVR
jgi:hypothetical protein